MKKFVHLIFVALVVVPSVLGNSITLLPWETVPAHMLEFIPEGYTHSSQLVVQPELVAEVSASIGASYVMKTPGKRIEATALLLINEKGSVEGVLPLESRDPMEMRAILQIAYTWRFKPGEDETGPVSSAVLWQSRARISARSEIVPAVTRNPYGFSRNYKDFLDEEGNFFRSGLLRSCQICNAEAGI
ncbi:MAG: hypothetical protein LR015_12930 [Verrucomicrobia bacterium]|nr:hypothetical protein [Verrucomicrobiota bacterium]